MSFKVEPGIYKLNSDLNMIPQRIISDNLYLFPNSETNIILKETIDCRKRSSTFNYS